METPQWDTSIENSKNQEEDYFQYSLAINNENILTPMFTRAQHFKALKEEEER